MSSSSGSGNPVGSPRRDVVSRLTDPKLYTGSHVHRFNEDGTGRGLAGRVNLVDFKGNTNTRTLDVTPGLASPKKPVITSPIGQQKFGTQASKALTIILFRNGDKHHKGEAFTVRGVKTLDQLCDRASSLVRLPTGAVRKLYKPGGKIAVKVLEDLEDGCKYLCCGGEKPAEDEKQAPAWLQQA